MKRIIDEVSWQEACNGIRCAECALKNNNGSCKFELYVREQPSYEEPKQGEWEKICFDNVPRIFVCSECNHRLVFPANFCPNCGARMKEGDEK